MAAFGELLRGSWRPEDFEKTRLNLSSSQPLGNHKLSSNRGQPTVVLQPGDRHWLTNGRSTSSSIKVERNSGPLKRQKSVEILLAASLDVLWCRATIETAELLMACDLVANFGPPIWVWVNFGQLIPALSLKTHPYDQKNFPKTHLRQAEAQKGACQGYGMMKMIRLDKSQLASWRLDWIGAIWNWILLPSSFQVSHGRRRQP